MRVAIVFPFFWLPRLCERDERFLAVYWRDKNARIIPVLGSVRILRHRKGPFTFFAPAPIQGEARQIERQVEPADQSPSILSRWPEDFFRELRARMKRKSWWKRCHIGDTRINVSIKDLEVFRWQIVSVEDPLLNYAINPIH